MTQFDLNIVFDLLKNISIVIASCVAIYGINSWRRETRWKKRYELAEEALSLFYEVQEAISIIRSPVMFEHEGKTRKKTENEHPSDTEIFERAYVVIERFEKNKEPFHKLRTIKYRFISVFGKEHEQPFNDIIKLTNKIISASNILGRFYWKDRGRKKLTDEQYEFFARSMQEYEDIIWEGSQEDKINADLNRIIHQMEQTCGAVINK